MRVRRPSPSQSPGPSTGWTSVPWTWRRPATGGWPKAASTRRWFSATLSGSSPVAAERLRLRKGPSETPPSRVVKPWGTGRGCAGGSRGHPLQKA